MRISDWSSDVCSSDLLGEVFPHLIQCVFEILLFHMGVAEGRFYPLVAHPLLNHEDVYTRVDHACSPGVAAGMEHEILVILQANPFLCPVPPRPKVPPGRHRDRKRVVWGKSVSIV